MLFWIYALVLPVALGGSLFLRGFYGARDKSVGTMTEEEFGMIVAACLFWPLVLLLVVVVGPFLLLYHTGEHFGQEKGEKK